MNRNHSEGLDQVLASYTEASEDFDARVLHDYIQRYPQFADALNRYAQVQLSSVRATSEEIAGTDLSDEELLPMQSKLLQRLQLLRSPIGAGQEDGTEAAKKLAAIKGAKATEAASIAVFGGIGCGQDDLFLLVTEPLPGISDVPDWVYSGLGGHLGVSSAGVRASITSRLGAQRFSASNKPINAAPLTWKEAVEQSITDEATKQAILRRS
ncbi:hypothetical protein [Diaphorobacter sp.]|uniref:hypothetical protein n=1 Tax=Diaphorobacter sp. TaxID=1934310 RepID=UPI002897EE44|nr:hypothetical protein [Diaphorobacter sp.]